jgi:hypothetical protein
MLRELILTIIVIPAVMTACAPHGDRVSRYRRCRLGMWGWREHAPAGRERARDGYGHGRFPR